MSANELVCPKHGPYAASLGSCPICSKSGNIPQPPHPLDEEDNLPTELGGRSASRVSGRATYAADSDSDQPTDLPFGRRSRGKGFLDSDEDEATSLGHKGAAIDDTVLEAQRTPVEAILWAKEGIRRGKIYPIKDDMIIGRGDRGDVDLYLDDMKVSKLHAKITLEEGTWVLTDFRTKNGTSVNGEKITAATSLKENDVIKIGDMIFVLKILE